jgi:S-adenosylmethionine:tRNA ribosyltransferase-isomerase
MLRTDELDYDLPPELIATHPVSPRDAARLLVVSRSDPSRLEDRFIRDLPDLLDPGDLLVFNTTRVVPARLRGWRIDSGGRAEALYLRDEPAPRSAAAPSLPRLRWAVLVRARRVKEGVRIGLLARDARPSGVTITLLQRVPDEAGAWLVEVTAEDQTGTPLQTPALLDRLGITPLPPYILKRRESTGDQGSDADDRRDYQTVFADPTPSEGGSVAAPTAGLHFTPALLDALAARGIARTDVTLHVGTGTFKPVETELVEQHPMHAEWCRLPPATLGAIRRTRAEQAKGRKGRVVAVGTTSARTIESYAALGEASQEPPPWLQTSLLITPGYRWRWTDALLTNFHLPRSTLLAMVAALLDSGHGSERGGGGEDGIARVRAIYAHAIARGYRFYSFGDAMLMLP